VRKKFDLPDRFVVAPNQFWRHKNHLGVLRALRILKDRGTPVHCVFTGLLHDARDPGNDYLSQVLQAIASEGVREHISLLGFVSREDLISLMRTAALVLQPSFSEGWSTSVQDAKALGRPVLCSDLPVHREQAPASLGFFSPADPADLADKLATAFSGLPAGPDEQSEAPSLAREIAAISTYRETLLAMCREAVTEKK
jgi:glycosyltransferase involved in cell wall biosynthesis